MMTTLFDQISEGGTTWSVAGLTRYIRELFELDYRLQEVEVAGEISNFTEARSGHLYFTLKDAEAQLKCVMWRSSAQALRFRPGEGDAVIARGRLSVYEAGGAYQLYADRLRPAGRGNLAIAFEQLKERLAEEGLFDQAVKKPLPRFPRKIGIVTSADAAALRDILNVLRRRYPLVQVLIAPTLVQGSEAPAQIVRALQWVDSRNDIDTIILARGGGSIEDLWAFNDESVARTIFAAFHPVVTGVGHETDFTIADFVADVRAPTPSAAAELAVPEINEIAGFVDAAYAVLVNRTTEKLARERDRVSGLRRVMATLSPRNRLEGNIQRLDSMTWRFERLAGITLADRRSKLVQLNTRLESVSPISTLRRGYAIVRSADGAIVRTVGDVRENEIISVRVSDGEIGATVLPGKFSGTAYDKG